MRRVVASSSCCLVVAAGIANAQREGGSSDDAPRSLPAEEARFDTAVFRAALQKRGLKKVLDLHVHDFPPTDALARMMMNRDMKLAEFADFSSPRQRRLAAVAEANQILADIIRDFPEHPSCFAWRFELARSALYDEAEWMIAPLLHRETPPADTKEVAARTVEALRLVDEFLQSLTAEYARLDALPLEEFETLEKSGRVIELDRLQPRGQYLRLWALFYDAVWRPDRDSGRAAGLHAVLEGFQANPEFVETPHAQSRIQVPSLLLAGMTQRRLNNPAKARDLLDRAIAAGNSIADTKERARVGWSVTLARLERVRVDRDEGKFQQALAALETLMRTHSDSRSESFTQRLSLALLLRSVERAWADEEDKDGNAEAAARHRFLAWQGLGALLDSNPAKSDEILIAVYDAMGGESGVARDPLDRAALVCGALTTAGGNDKAGADAASRAIQVGDALLKEPAADLGPIGPVVRFKLGVAEFRLGDRDKAARRFLELAVLHPTAHHAPQAAVYAVQLAYEFRKSKSDTSPLGADELFRTAVELLVTRFPETDAAEYWRYFHATELYAAGRFDEAAEQFRRIDSDHEFHVEALRWGVEATAAGLRSRAQGESSRSHEAIRAAKELMALQEQYGEAVRGALRDGRAVVDESAEALVTVAECHLLRTIDSPQVAIDLLEPFEDRFPGQRELWGRVWRVRMLAHERLGQLDLAMRAVPKYIAADPNGAEATLRWLYDALADEADVLRESDIAAARPKAEAALTLAERIGTLPPSGSAEVAGERGRQQSLMLAEANLRAERFDRARELFLEALPAGESLDSEVDIRASFGLAESLFGLGEFDAALPHFNRLAMRLAPEDNLRWRSLLRDLECRTALGEPPQQILKVIEQQRFLYPNLGGVHLAARFDRLESDNIRRRDAAQPATGRSNP